jgi:hypothetical protein
MLASKSTFSTCLLAAMCVSFAIAACGDELGEEPEAHGSSELRNKVGDAGIPATGESGKTLLVSDIDDTIRRTDVLDKVEAVVNALKSKNAFSGMSLLYSSWRDENKANRTITYLSAAPGMFILPGMRFLKDSGFPGDTTDVAASVVSGRQSSETAGAFKTKKLKEMFDTALSTGAVPHTVILVGDNGEQDMIAYGNYIDYVANRGGATDRIFSFIHHVYDSPRGSEIVAPHRPFATAADLAVQLAGLSLIGTPSLARVLHEVASEVVQAPPTVIPSFMKCRQFSAWPKLDQGEPLSNDYSTVKADVTQLCQ